MRWVAGVVGVVLLAGCTTGDTDPKPTHAATPDYSAARSAPVADPIYPRYGNPSLDVLHYDLALSYTPGANQLAGTATLRIRIAAAVDRLTLDFSHALAVDKATLDGRDVTPTRSGDKLTAPAGRTLPVDRQVTLAVRYHGVPKTVPIPSSRGDDPTMGLQSTRDGSAYSMQEPYGAFTWYPANDQPSDKALYDEELTVPDGWTAVSNGTLRGHDEKAGRTTFRWHSYDPMASYLVTIAIDRYREIDATGPHGLPITYWVTASRPGATAVLQQLPDMLTRLEGWFGPFPFRSIGVVLVGSDSAMETQTMITMGGPGGTMTATNGYADDLAHELAHQWFGDTVTPRTWQDLWLNEGFAMYAQLLYSASAGHSSAAGTLSDWLNQDTRLRTDYGPPSRYKPDEFAEPNVYLCPALMLNAIRTTLHDDTAFFALLRDWAQQHRDSNQDRASFTEFVNEHTGHDFTALINAWLDSDTTPSA
jgi:aminopeptidase N